MFVGGGVIGQRNALVVFDAICMSNSSPQNTWTFNSQPLGMEHASRVLAALILSSNANSSTVGASTSVSLNGVAAAQTYVTPGTLTSHWEIWLAASATGTSGTFSFTRSTGNGYSSMYASVFSLYYLRDPSTQYDEAEQNADPSSVNIGTRSGGAITSAAVALSASPDITWTGVTVQGNQDGGVGAAVQMSAAMMNRTTSSASYNVQADTTTNTGMLSASFR